ncbi:predicted protein [Scheffersomyces stipitis CBS 6054]|uniref:Acyl-coenzyme A diphosphatase SCS3 n=1 Tax=Scheffersomyces stipitis (strain ATCC 58785 / CBS 6054 / NBRC 10063 / NRRL Y-11545) TaxID=322104 RepID=A3LYM5_PICST|nr:predicted protein [Scheffersomyces stipitis CBS 6054]ABN68198.2 predicted protein [Scheffersomyces stipitis CBS 6054]
MPSEVSSVYDRHFRFIEMFFRQIQQRFKMSPSEFLFVISFLVNFVIGKIVHSLSPDEEVYNYYTNKKNVLNQVFVKNGWFWTTANIVLFYGIVLYKEKSSAIRINIAKGAVIRYVLATVWWIFFTQWFFGLPIMDKVFVYTGGSCVIEKETHPGQSRFLHLFEAAGEEVGNKLSSTSITSYHCRRIKGSWEGGHDPSGHVFLLIHSSLYLFLEVSPYWVSYSHFKASLSKLRKEVVKPVSLGEKFSSFIKYSVANPPIVVAKLITLWWFMLLMTNIYFHSLGEKLVGLVFGYIGVVGIYYVPRIVEKQKQQ